MKPIIIGGVFVGALATILWVGVQSASIPVFKVRKLLSYEPEGPVRVSEGQIAEIESLSPLRFKVTPRSDPQTYIWVESKRTVPENFKVGVDVGLEGNFDSRNGIFNAYRITTQCPSKYEASKEGRAGYASEAPSASEVLGTPPARPVATDLE